MIVSAQRTRIKIVTGREHCCLAGGSRRNCGAARFFVAAFFTWSVGLPATVAPGHVISLVAWFCFDGMTWAHSVPQPRYEVAVRNYCPPES